MWAGSRRFYLLAYTGETAGGKAEGRGTIRCKAFIGTERTLHGAAFHGGAMLPCRAVFALDKSGNTFAGPLAASLRPADGARGAVRVVRRRALRGDVVRQRRGQPLAPSAARRRVGPPRRQRCAVNRPGPRG